MTTGSTGRRMQLTDFLMVKAKLKSLLASEQQAITIHMRKINMKTDGMHSFPRDIFFCTLLSIAIALAVVVLVTLSVWLFSTSAYASDSVDHSPELDPAVRIADIQRGSLLFKTDHRNLYKDAPVLDTDVQMQITAMLARVKVRQRFRNEGQDWVEGIYVFPLPENAAVDHMRMRIGERVIEGQIKERKQAKKIYDQAKRSGHKAALIEQERPNIFTNSVANIGPGETVVIEIEYQQSLAYDNGKFSIRFPMVVAPRFIPGNATPIEEILPANTGMGWAVNTDQVVDASRITPPVITEDEALVNPVTIQIDLNAGIPLSDIISPYHPIRIQKHQPGQATIELLKDSVPADRDFVLEWIPQPAYTPRAALFTEMGEGREYSLLMVMPPVTEQSTMVSLPREVIFIIDTSGSMGGTSIRQAKAALRMAIKRLKSHDRFNVIQFNSSTHSLFNHPVTASSDHLRIAQDYVNSLDANGGTVMAPALKMALSFADSPNHIRQVVFLTDGAVGNEDALFQLIHDDLGKARLFTVGIGSAPNSHFMTRAAQFGRGTFTYIGDLSEVEQRMRSLFTKLETPVMSDLSIKWPVSAGNVEQYPARIPDLYAGEPLQVVIATEKIQGEVTITGIRGNRPWTARFPVVKGTMQQGIGVLWARQRIRSLMDSLHDGADRTEVRESVIKTALEHHLVSKYTSLVAVDVTPSRPEENHLKKSAVPTNLPKGWDRDKVFGPMPQTATSAQLHILIGLILFLLGGFYWRFLSPYRHSPA
ncbi:MAG: marine proteobacterial sortase target protein [Gammaproteobacteria bacterium]|nr:MAG: marine proteobacterial sortase target protein [Gammaproteobacteria bacterium]